MSADFYIYLTTFLVLFAVIIVWLIFFLKYKHYVRIKELVNGRKVIKDDKARDFVRDGVNFWQLRKEKNREQKLMPVPPPEAIELSYRGKKCVECYRTQTGEYIFLQDTGNVGQFPMELLNEPPEGITELEDGDEKTKQLMEWAQEVRDQWCKENNIIEAYQPLTTKQRLILISNIKKAESRRGKSWREHLPMIVGISAVVILCLALFVFWGEMAKPVLEARQIGIQEQRLRIESMEIMRDIKQGVQSIGSKQDKLEKRIENMEDIPPD